jgi:NAD+ kinase
MTTIGIIYKKEDPIISGTALQVQKELKKEGYKINLEQARFVITFGGDGTILKAARKLAKTRKPILGIHLGGVGFLTEIELEELKEALELIRQGKYVIDERAMLEATVGGKAMLALNDLVLAKTGISRVIKFELEEIGNYTADGLIIATASGSTAYNLAAGGPILTPQSQSLIVSAICAHSLSNRSLVLEGPLSVVLQRGEEVIVTADGQEVFPVKVGQRLRVRRSNLKTRFIRLKGYNFFEKLRDTFSFGKGN